VAAILRGQIRWGDLGTGVGSEQQGRRPVLVISQDVFNERSETAIVLAVTSREPRAGFPLTMPLGDPALPKPSWVRISQIRTLSTHRLGEAIGTAGDDELARIIEGLVAIVGE
jgi:mRNA interferase MazF